MAPQEFPSDEHRAAHVAALVREQDGYAARAAAHESKGETQLAEHMTGRAGQVKEQLDRLAAEAKTASARAQRRGGQSE